MRIPSPFVRACLLAACCLLAALPLCAYTVYLKDGTHIRAKEKYRLEGGRAIITLLNGTQSFIDAREIDVKRTEEANRVDYGGNAVVVQTPQETVAPPPSQERTLRDLIASREAGPRDLPEVRRTDQRQAARSQAKTRAGFFDFSTLARKPYPQIEMASELQGFFRAQGVEELEIFQGTQANRPLLEITTPSEGAVFRALAVSASALMHIRGTHPRIEAFELLMTTPDRKRAGQFVLTPEDAAGLAAKSVELSAFFLENVQF